MAEITLKSIEEKLGFDPLNPPRKEWIPDDVDDSPSIWAPLTEEELAYLYFVMTGRKVPLD